MRRVISLAIADRRVPAEIVASPSASRCEVDMYGLVVEETHRAPGRSTEAGRVTDVNRPGNVSCRGPRPRTSAPPCLEQNCVPAAAHGMAEFIARPPTAAEHDLIPPAGRYRCHVELGKACFVERACQRTERREG